MEFIFTRKYLRDTDRQELAKLAWRYTLESTEASLPDVHYEKDTEKRMDYLMTAHKIWNYGKVAFKPQVVNGMLSRAYRAFRQGKVCPLCYWPYLVGIPYYFELGHPVTRLYFEEVPHFQSLCNISAAICNNESVHKEVLYSEPFLSHKIFFKILKAFDKM